MFKLTKSKIFLILCFAFLVGVGLRSFISISYIILYTMSLLAGVMLVVYWKNKLVKIISFSLLFIVMGIFRYELSIPTFDSEQIHFYNGKEINFTAQVASEPDIRKSHVKYTVRAVSNLDTNESIQGQVLVNNQIYPSYQYGDLLDIKCGLEEPEPIYDEINGRTFDYNNYLARFNIYSICNRPVISKIGEGQGNLLMAKILNIKNTFSQKLAQVVHEPEASFLGGLVLGARKAIPDNLIEAFNTTGTTHIIALSGYNITIIAVFIQNFCRSIWISRKKSFWISIFAIAFFILLTGAPASVFRAGIMGVLALLARQVGRTSKVTNVMMLAVVVMLLINPKVLIYDAGFQLSFLATIGLVYLSPWLDKLFKKLPDIFELRSSLSATMSAMIFTLPLILLTFGRLSIIAPLVNMIVLPMIPIAMAIGFLTGIVSLIWLPLGTLIGWGAWAILRFILFIIEWFSELPNISYNLPPVNWWWVALAYILMFFVLYKLNKKPLKVLKQSAA